MQMHYPYCSILLYIAYMKMIIMELLRIGLIDLDNDVSFRCNQQIQTEVEHHMNFPQMDMSMSGI